MLSKINAYGTHLQRWGGGIALNFKKGIADCKKRLRVLTLLRDDVSLAEYSEINRKLQLLSDQRYFMEATCKTILASKW